jgi:hypothetical protein
MNGRWPNIGIPRVAAFDPDAAAYIAGVEAADGQALEAGVRTAMNELVLTVKSQALLWESLGVFGPLAGPRTLAGAMVPLKGSTVFTGVNFTSGDYDRKNGIRGGNRELAIAPVGSDWAPSTGRIKFGALVTEPVPGNNNWDGVIMQQDQDPMGDLGKQRTIINVNKSAGVVGLLVRCPQSSIPVPPMTAETMPKFYFIERIDDINILSNIPNGAFQAYGSAVALAEQPTPPFTVFANPSINNARVMAAFIGTSTGQASAQALQNACLAYRTALQSAIL